MTPGPKQYVSSASMQGTSAGLGLPRPLKMTQRCSWWERHSNLAQQQLGPRARKVRDGPLLLFHCVKQSSTKGCVSYWPSLHMPFYQLVLPGGIPWLSQLTQAVQACVTLDDPDTCGNQALMVVTSDLARDQANVRVVHNIHLRQQNNQF